MTNTLKTDAIVLKKVAYGDSDLIVTLFSRDLGRISGFARSARVSKRRFQGAFEIGSVIGIEYSEKAGSELVTITGAHALRPIGGAMKSLVRIHAMTVAIELALSFLQERQAAPEKYDLLCEFLIDLSEADPSLWDILAFKFKWLSHSGFRPNLDCCTVCGKERGIGAGWVFDFEHGGLVCATCAARPSVGMRLSKLAIRGFEELAAGGGFGEDGWASDAEPVINRYIAHILGRPFKNGFEAMDIYERDK
jgi:DNA repair protein RecO (recombination protein O)